MQHRPSFKVVTFVMIILTAFALLQHAIGPLVPIGAPNELLKSTSSYMRAGGYQLIKWYPLSRQAFADARRQDKPILLVIGAPWSAAARQMDAQVFSSEQVQRVLRYDFVCIRVDTLEHPDWAGTYLPTGRATSSLCPEFQAWVLDPDGRMYFLIGGASFYKISTAPYFAKELANARERYTELAQAKPFGSDQPLPAGAEQAANVLSFKQAPQSASLDAETYSRALSGAEVARGSFGTIGWQGLWPNAWGFQLAYHGPNQVVANLNALLQSPASDVLDGGFFDGAEAADWSNLVFDKSAAMNAEMAILFARLAVMTHSPIYRAVAIRTIDCLLTKFANDDGFVRPCQIGDEGTDRFRSARYSFSPRTLRALLPDGDDRAYAWNHLGLRLQTNAQMVPRVSDLTTYIGKDAAFNRIVAALKLGRAKPEYPNEITMDVEATVLARLDEAARMLGEEGYETKIAGLIAHLSSFVVGEDVLHSRSSNSAPDAMLIDYLAFADVSLQNYLSTGNLESLSKGFAVFNRAMNKFQPEANFYVQGTDTDAHRAAPDSLVPQLCDDFYESCTARIVRLGWTYGTLLAHSPVKGDRVRANDLIARSSGLLSQMAAVALPLGPYVGGFATASAMVTDARTVFAVGVDPIAMAVSFSRKSPLRSVVPCAGPVRPDLQARPAGYYVQFGGVTSGPFTESQAIQVLPATLGGGS